MIAAIAPAATFPPAAGSASGLRGELGSLLLRRTLQGALIGAGVGLSYFSVALPLLIDAEADMFASFDAMVLRSACNVMILACLLTLALRLAGSLPHRLAGAAEAKSSESHSAQARAKKSSAENRRCGSKWIFTTRSHTSRSDFCTGCSVAVLEVSSKPKSLARI